MIKETRMKYKRIARSRCGLGKWHTLWLGDDHLLAMESTGYSEEYTRFYFKEIQAVITRRTVAGKVWNAVFGSVVLISLTAGVADYSANSILTPKNIFAGISGGVFLIMLLWNIFHGPTCRCHVRTQVGSKELTALDRIRSVKKMLGRIRPLVGQLQGGITRQEIIELTRMGKDAPPAVFPSATAPKIAGTAPSAAENRTSSYGGGLHLAAFLLLIADAGISSLQMLHNSKVMVSLTAIISLTFLLLAIIALIKQKENFVSPLAKGMTWSGVAVMVAGSVISYFFMVFLNIAKFKGGVTTQNDLFDFYAAIRPADHPAYAFFILAYAIVAAGIAITGLVAINRERGRTADRRP